MPQLSLPYFALWPHDDPMKYSRGDIVLLVMLVVVVLLWIVAAPIFYQALFGPSAKKTPRLSTDEGFSGFISPALESEVTVPISARPA